MIPHIPMGPKNKACFPFPIFMFLIIPLSTAAHTISLGQSQSANQKLVPKGSNFELQLGFLTPASDLPSLIGKNNNVAIILKSAIAGTAVSLCLLLGLAWRFMKRRVNRTEKPIDGSLTQFTYLNLQHMTKNFSEKLGGGGFGSVFRGTLPDSTAIAVKKLNGVVQLGEKQFQKELTALGLIQHANLIGIRGFCCEGTERLLVYDYMPNGSLDRLLFGNESNVLDWKTRHGIILGIARGLAYLHEECRESIIHCDVKPENILLDSNLCPKVADFSMAKLTGHDLSRVLTKMRGSAGYLAPEWMSGLAVSPKCDAYSFGMMVFELVSGRRNMGCSESGRMEYLPVLAAAKVIDGEVPGLLDKRLKGNAGVEELNRVCRLACWCIQDCEDHRPSMKQIVQILEGGLEVNVPPVPRSLQHLVEV